MGEAAEKGMDGGANGEQSIRPIDAAAGEAKRKEPAKKTIDDLGPTLPRVRWWGKIWHVLMRVSI